ncbi:putative UDP-Gal or UDP-GlcNAc-dependent glycosyltransferase [Trypanosoma cruzi]|uniref:Hexosyltransferase n=2 Tax=Trypanosoma cruzi TaxID=5693 RepID=Q4DJT2_TRYCC|nr:UDP-Gal or UDP-GlcNAc-dependent glycosyltransferase, putative [Trypanosoma cruzi]EAN92783.1 UDP-Gal or UDP-GlcNAc-dependent glycosyltransferase, putative [Trypanosoma cruzi]PWV07740.1 putative UDP-Gal or UDP-GlcNAc-dependent glycosyltransferase [Trypanosoma cruzi]|eukprot:XP_814634.1 UDP-Gal or UDP-GlcNAc-dependent glycosyltransferase [Trypanosoma cruzi strain CL Brener]
MRMQFSDKWMASVVGVWFLLVLFAVSCIQEIETNVDAYLEDDFAANSSQQPQLLPRTTDGEALRYVPRDVVDAWKKRDFLIVLGIPTVDVEARQRRRHLQRSTCWRFPGVATRANNFTGAMLVLYVLARHPSHGHNYSATLLEEAAQWHDVLTTSIDEGRVTTNKTVGGSGFWGLEAEIGMSRKTYFLFDFALRLFPTVPYIAKGDDDMFLRVPQYLADLRTLPRRKTYWGVFIVHRPGDRFRFMNGMCATLARDVAEKFVSYKPLQRLVRLPYSKEREPEFLGLNMDHENAMVGRVLHEMRYKDVVFFSERPCRFHDVHEGFGVKNVTESSVVVHHVWESDYETLMQRFGNDTSPAPKRFRCSKGWYIFDC